MSVATIKLVCNLFLCNSPQANIYHVELGRFAAIVLCSCCVLLFQYLKYPFLFYVGKSHFAVSIWSKGVIREVQTIINVKYSHNGLLLISEFLAL